MANRAPLNEGLMVMMAPAAASVIDNARFGGLQMRVAILCAIVAMLDGFDTQSIAYVAPEIGARWGVDMASFGSIFGGGLLGLAVGAFIFSSMGDRFGRKLVILACVFIFGAFSLFTATADTLNELLAYRFLTGIGLGGAMPNIIALTNEYAPARLKTTLVTIMFCGFPLGSTIGGFVAVPLIQSYGWEWVFVLGGVMPILLLPILALFLPESVRFLAVRAGDEAKIARILGKISPDITAEVFISRVRAETRVVTGPRRIPVLELFADGHARTTSFVWAAFFMNLLVMYFLVNWLPSLLRESGLSLGVAIMSTALLNLGGVAGGIALGRLMDKRNPFRILVIAFAVGAFSIAVIAASGSNLGILLAAATLAGFGISGGQIGLNAVTATLYPTRMRSSGIGFALGVGRIGSILGPVIGGILIGMGWTTESLLFAAVIPALIAMSAIIALGRVQASAKPGGHQIRA